MMMQLIEKDVSINDIIERDVAILNSLANYTYTHQLLKCKVEILSLKVLKLQFTCKIKEHKDFILLALSTAGSTVQSSWATRQGLVYSLAAVRIVYGARVRCSWSWLGSVRIG